MREIVHLQAGQCGNQIGAKVSLGPFKCFNTPREGIRFSAGDAGHFNLFCEICCHATGRCLHERLVYELSNCMLCSFIDHRVFVYVVGFHTLNLGM
jgi:hypothetical protein